MMKRLILATAVSALCLAPALAQPGPDADQGRPGPGHRGMGRMERMERGERGERMDMMRERRGRMIEQLNLTDAQEVQMKKLRADHQKKQVALQAKVRIARIEMREMMDAAAPDRSAIEKKMKEVSDLQYQEKLAWLDHTFAVRAILTPEQIGVWKKGMGRP